MKPPKRLFKRNQRDEHSADHDATGRDTIFRNNEFRIRLLVQRSRNIGNEGDDLVLILDPRDRNGATLFGLLQGIPSFSPQTDLNDPQGDTTELVVVPYDRHSRLLSKTLQNLLAVCGPRDIRVVLYCDGVVTAGVIPGDRKLNKLVSRVLVRTESEMDSPLEAADILEMTKEPIPIATANAITEHMGFNPSHWFLIQEPQLNAIEGY